MADNHLQPASVRLRDYEPASLTTRIVLASSNGLRRHLGFDINGILESPIPHFVTRRNPSLDNYFADLLLRSCYGAVDYLPSYHEHLILGSPYELSCELNPVFTNALLIGIGGRSQSGNFFKVYDEHAAHGMRTAPSVSEIVFREHLESYSDNIGIGSLRKLLSEISHIDSQGGATPGHLYNILKSLNVAEFVRPGFVFEPLHYQEKRAVIGACLSSVAIAINDFQNYDLQESINDLANEWETYLAKIEKRIKYGFPDKILSSAVREIKGFILRPKEPQINGYPSYLTLKRILFSFRHCWHPSIVSYLLEFLFEALRQAQQSFEEIKHADIPIRKWHDEYAFIHYEQAPKDRLPHRGLMARMNSQSIKGLVVVVNPRSKTTAVFSTKHLSPAVWKSFVEALLHAEPDGVWYVPTATDGTIANFMLNGTESFRGITNTKLSSAEFFDLFVASVERTEARAKQSTQGES